MTWTARKTRQQFTTAAIPKEAKSAMSEGLAEIVLDEECFSGKLFSEGWSGGLGIC
jgi:hypothetical protein